jgi:hypothetical protein
MISTEITCDITDTSVPILVIHVFTAIPYVGLLWHTWCYFWHAILKVIAIVW